MELLKRLSECDAPSGCEGAIMHLIEEEIKGYADEIYKDSLGNLVARKKGSGKKVMFAAHADEIGVVVTYIDEKGFLRFANVGGLLTSDLVGRCVRFENGIVGTIGTEEDNEKRKRDKMYIDIGADSREVAEKCVSIGDMGVFVGGFYEQNGKVMAKALDNRAGCYVLIEALKEVKSENDLYFVFTTQEEGGLRGARTAAYSIAPDYAISVDIADSGDMPNARKTPISLGKGAGIKVMDYSVITNHEVREKMINFAEENNVSYQLEIMTEGGTDAGVIQFARGGVKTGGISIPTRYFHTPAEVVSIDDLNSCKKLCVLFAEKI